MNTNELRKKRKELGLTQEQVARLTGVSRRTYQTYEENDIPNKRYEELIALVKELENGDNVVLSLKAIKTLATNIFVNYPEIHAAYLFGSYARGEATGKSDVDILVVSDPMGMKFYGIGAELKDAFHKEVDLLTHRQLIGNDEYFVRKFLKDAIKIYG